MDNLKLKMGTSHTWKLYNSVLLKNIIDNVSRKILEIKSKQPNINGLVFCGISGAAVGFPVSLTTRITPFLVRKREDSTHGMYLVESFGFVEEKLNYLIIDDLIDSGNTIDYILENMTICIKNSDYIRTGVGICKGIILYNHPYNNNDIKRKIGSGTPKNGAKIYYLEQVEAD